MPQTLPRLAKLLLTEKLGQVEKTSARSDEPSTRLVLSDSSQEEPGAAGCRGRRPAGAVVVGGQRCWTSHGRGDGQAGLGQLEQSRKGEARLSSRVSQRCSRRPDVRVDDKGVERRGRGRQTPVVWHTGQMGIPRGFGVDNGHSARMNRGVRRIGDGRSAREGCFGG